MDRQDAINQLIKNIELMNAHKVAEGIITRKELGDFIENQKLRYAEKTDVQLQNLLFINC